MKWLKILIIALLACFFLVDSFRATLIGPGWKESGEFLGVEVEASIDKAVAQLIGKGFEEIDLDKLYPDRLGIGCLGRSFSDDHEIRVFQDTGWVPGIVCIAFRNNKVVALGWDYSYF